MINLNEAQELSGLIGRVMEDMLIDKTYTEDNLTYKDLRRAREIANLIVSDLTEDN